MPTICESCQDKTCLKEKNPKRIRPCEKLEALLRSKKVYSRDYIRPRISPERTKREKKEESDYLREIPVEDIEKVAEQRAFELKYSQKSHEDKE